MLQLLIAMVAAWTAGRLFPGYSFIAGATAFLAVIIIIPAAVYVYRIRKVHRQKKSS